MTVYKGVWLFGRNQGFGRVQQEDLKTKTVSILPVPVYPETSGKPRGKTDTV
jgi:hypothetical protein